MTSFSDPLGKVVYALHHPYAGRGAPPDPATWRKEFGYLIQGPRAIAPVVVGEWTNFTAAQLDSPYCWANAPQSVPAFLDYLAAIHAGLNACQLDASTLPQAGSARARMSSPGSATRISEATA